MLRDIALYRVISHFMNDGTYYKYQSIDREDRIIHIKELYVSMLHYKKNDKEYHVRENVRRWGDYIRSKYEASLGIFGRLKCAKGCFFCTK